MGCIQAGSGGRHEEGCAVQQIRRLAIVNRTEAAMRALTAVAELNAAGNQPHITTVVIHTDPDARAWYVRAADEAVSLGPATYVDPADGHRKSSYLDEEKVVKALREAQVDAAWPGWGFVAESASFAQRCEEAGIVFVGPGSETIRLLGDKVAAKRLAEQAGVPVVPWSGGPVDSAEHAVEIARRIWPSATRPCSSSSSCRPHVTWRCRSSRTVRAPSGRSGCGTAASSGGTRR